MANNVFCIVSKDELTVIMGFFIHSFGCRVSFCTARLKQGNYTYCNLKIRERRGRDKIIHFNMGKYPATCFHFDFVVSGFMWDLVISAG